MEEIGELQVQAKKHEGHFVYEGMQLPLLHMIMSEHFPPKFREYYLKQQMLGGSWIADLLEG